MPLYLLPVISKKVVVIPLTQRQKKIAEIVRANGPIAGDKIAERLHVTRAALRSDLAILVMSGVIDSRTKVGYFYLGRQTFEFFAEEIKNIKVRDVQSMPVAVDIKANAYDTMVAMFTEDVGSVFVVEKEGLLAGIISRKDILKASLNSGGKLASVPVKMAMTPLAKLVTTTPEETVAAAARKIIDNEVDCLPVVQEIDGEKKKYKVIGRLTKTNVTRLLVDLAEGKGGIHHN